MELDAFSARLGASQGRVVATDGTITFVLGDEEPGHFHELGPGDFAEVLQSVDLTSVDFVRSRLELEVRSLPAPGLAWQVSIMVDGAKRASATVIGARRRRVEDLTANVSKLSGTHTVGVRLELAGT